MDLRALVHRRRYRRLGLALFAALMVHLGLVLTGNWGLLLFSTPSNQDRVLTLSLENTTYEGLKETSLEEEDTINDSTLGEAAEQPKELLTDVELHKENKSHSLSEEVPELVEEALEAEKLDALASQNIFHNAPSRDEQTSPIERPQPNGLASDASTNSISNEDSPIEFITSRESEIKVTETSPVKVAANQPVLKELEVDEVEMLNKKIERWSSTVSKKLELKEPLLWEENGNQYAASFRKLPAETDMDTDEVVVEIATDRDGKKLTTSLRLKKMAFSNFAQFVHQWDSNVSVHNDEMNGRFHSNTRVNLTANRHGSPLFHGKVTTASYFVDIEGSVPRKDIFLAGLETGVKKISMPKPSVLFDQVQSDQTVKSQLIESDSRLIFKPDGSYLLQAHDEIGVMQRYTIGDQPLYILAAPGASLSLSGTVNGAVAVYSPKRIIIEGNLEYLSTDNIEHGGDFLGLISGRNVVIAKRKVVPEGDLNIQAAIYAKNRFEVKQLIGKRVGTLNILGSVSAGSITATEPRYATNIVFDTRLENLRPPGFPVTDRYELLAKTNSWQLEDDPFFESLDEDEVAASISDGYLINADERNGVRDPEGFVDAVIKAENIEGAITADGSGALRGHETVNESIKIQPSQTVETANDVQDSNEVDESSQFENYSE